MVELAKLGVQRVLLRELNQCCMFDMQLQGGARGCGQEAVQPTFSLSGNDTSRHFSQLEAAVKNLSCWTGDAGNAESKMASATQQTENA